MKPITRKKLREAQIFCDENDKSTEFMLEYMQDVAGVDLDCVLNYLSQKNEVKKPDAHGDPLPEQIGEGLNVKHTSKVINERRKL